MCQEALFHTPTGLRAPPPSVHLSHCAGPRQLSPWEGAWKGVVIRAGQEAACSSALCGQV